MVKSKQLSFFQRSKSYGIKSYQNVLKSLHFKTNRAKAIKRMQYINDWSRKSGLIKTRNIYAVPVAFLVLILLIIILVTLYIRRKQRKPRYPRILLTGPSGAGKTALFGQVRLFSLSSLHSPTKYTSTQNLLLTLPL